MNKDFKIKFGLRVKEIRLANKLTQEQLAEKLDIERISLARIESGKHFPSSENLEKFADVLNIELSDLFNMQHFKSKEALIKEILSTLDTFNMDKIQYVYKSVMNLKNLK